MWNPFEFLFPKKFLGIDIGTSYLKVVELSKAGHQQKLENYGTLQSSVIYQKPFRTFEKNTLVLSSEDIARAILAIIKETRIKTRACTLSIPDFSTFFTNIELPPMTREELPEAVRAEARSHIPLPIGEVTLDWQVIEGEVSDTKKTNLKILLVAVPNEVINQYQRIAKIADLELIALEAEVFGLIRSLVDEEEKRPISIIDIGARSTTCSIVEKKKLKISHSFDMSGNELTRMVAKSLNIDYQEAENLKKKYGISNVEGKAGEVKEVLLPLIDVIVRESERIFNTFSSTERKEIQKVILTGGTALLPGLKDYFAKKFKKEVEVTNPFTRIFYPPILEKTLENLGPSYAIAVGMALRGFEY